MADKYNKVTPKVHPYTYVGIIGFIMIIVGLIFIFMPTEKEKIYQSYISQQNVDKEFFKKDHPFDQVKYKSSLFNKGLEDIIDDEEFVMLYIGNPSCAACVNNIGAFQYYYDLTDMNEYFDRIYYLNNAEDPKGLATLNESYQQITTATPQLVIFHNGTIIRTFTVASETDRTAINSNAYLFFLALKNQLQDL